MIYRKALLQLPRGISLLSRNSVATVCPCLYVTATPSLNAPKLPKFALHRNLGNWDTKTMSAGEKGDSDTGALGRNQKQNRNQDLDGDGNANLSYEQLLEEMERKESLIIDVREHEEILETGKLPGSVHIPMANVTEFLTRLPEDEFQERLGISKPDKATKIILSCRSGKRSAMVQDQLQKLGYRACNYAGGWLEWESRRK